MKGRDKYREELVAEYLAGGVSYREMAARYGVASSTLQRWVEAAEKAGGLKRSDAAGGSSERVGVGGPAGEEDLAAEVKRLREELRKARLHNELLNAMIDIAEEQLEVPIRKKPGARQ
jgi:transposase-like protein